MSESKKNPDSDSESVKFSEEKQDLAELDRRLKEIRDQEKPPSKAAQRMKVPPGNVLGLAFRVSVELLSALAVGAAIGWSLDLWLESRPWLMLVFVILGGAAGILNVYRLASGFGYAAGYTSSDGQSEDQNSSDPKERQE